MSDEFRVLQLLVLPRENEKSSPPQSSVVGAFLCVPPATTKRKSPNSRITGKSVQSNGATLMALELCL